MDMASRVDHCMDRDIPGANIGITLSTSSVSARIVTCEATNDQKDIGHEIVVAPLASHDAVLPYVESSKVDEDAASHIGEVEELKSVSPAL
jgi:hypothetical protein